MNDSKHKNYEILNLIGYGLAKFDSAFIRQFGFKTKTAFYAKIVESGIAETIGTVKNRQDLFDPFFNNKRKGWWQKGDTYLHRKVYIDSLFGEYDVNMYASLVGLYIESQVDLKSLYPNGISPIIKSKFKQLQKTGREAELYFLNNYNELDFCRNGRIEDARLYGDGYDFQIQLGSNYLLVEVKGLKTSSGSVRLTQKEYECSKEYKEKYNLIVISNLEDIPKMNTINNPSENLELKSEITISQQITYHSKSMVW